MFHKHIKYILTFFIIGFLLYSIYYYNSSSIEQKEGLSNMIWYQIIPDRWANGSTNNDATSRSLDWNGISSIQYNDLSLKDAWLLSGTSPWGKDWFVLTELEKKISDAYSKNNSITSALATSSVLRNRWFGGDFEGMYNHLDYLANLGIDIILLHPIWLADSAMRYDVKDRRHIDPRLTDEFDNKTSTYTDYIGSGYGDTWDLTQSDKDFFKLVNAFHNKGMRVVIDMSLLYMSSNNYIIKEVALDGKKSPYYEWFDFTEKQYKNDYQSCSLSFFYDPKEYPGVEDIYYQGWRGDCSKVYIRRGVGTHRIPDGLYDYYVKILQRWLGVNTIDSKEYQGIDGIRIDASGEFPNEVLYALHQDIKKINPHAIMMTEEWSTNTRSIGYQEADTMSFYPIRLWAEALLIQQGHGLVEGIGSLIKKIEQFYKDSMIDTSILMNYLGSHDTDRILSRLIYHNRDLAIAYFRQGGTDILWKQGHFARDAPWISRTDHSAHYIHTQPGPSDVHLLKGLIAFQFLMPGSPVIYYGDEIGMYGADDPDNRQPMRWDISDHFPRHICKRGDNPLEYCYTDGSTENYSIDNSISDWYKKLITLKKTSASLLHGTLSMDICYQSDKESACISNGLPNNPVRGFHRKSQDDHIMYIGLGDSEFTSLKIQTGEPSSLWTNILNDQSLESDENGFINITDIIRNDRYLIIRKA